MTKIRLFPGQSLVLHRMPALATMLITIGAAVVEGFSLFALVLVPFLVVWMWDLGVVVVSPHQLKSYRVSGVRAAQTPLVIAVDIDMFRRRKAIGYFYGTYYYPVLTLVDGSTIRLPIACASRAKASQHALLIRRALEVPVPGSVAMPQGRIASAMSGSRRSGL